VFSEGDAKLMLRDVSEIVFFDALSRRWPPEALKRAFVVIQTR